MRIAIATLMTAVTNSGNESVFKGLCFKELYTHPHLQPIVLRNTCCALLLITEYCRKTSRPHPKTLSPAGPAVEEAGADGDLLGGRAGHLLSYKRFRGGKMGDHGFSICTRAPIHLGPYAAQPRVMTRMLLQTLEQQEPRRFQGGIAAKQCQRRDDSDRHNERGDDQDWAWKVWRTRC